jgi:serine/threonine-protein kinase
VHVQLIDAETDAHLWAERYDRKLDDIFAVETDIATNIADALQAELTGAERQAIASRPTKSSAAHELYLKGRYLWRNFYAPGYERVRDYFEQAIALDGSYAPAYNGLSLYYSFAAANAIFPPNDSWPRAEEAVRKSLSLDNTLPEAYNALAAIELYYKRDWPAAERAFLRGMQLDPNFGDIPAHYGLCLSYFGRNNEALAQMERAAQLDPFFPGVNLHRGVVFFFLRDYDCAAAQFAKTLELFPGYAAAHEYFGEVCAKKEMPSEAITQWCAALRLNGQAEDARVLEQGFATAGFDAALRTLGQRQLETLDAKRARGEYVPAAHYLFAQIRRGNMDEAFACLAEVMEERDWFALQVGVNPMLDRLRDDPRYEMLVKKVVGPNRQ